LWTGVSLSQTILQPGDIAIVGYNFKDLDEFTFITFVDLDPGTIIYITDCGWTSNNDFRVGEGIVTYTAPPAGKVSGSLITFGIDSGFTKTGVSGFFGLSVAGDQLIVYQGSFSSPQFIFALNCNGNAVWQTSAIDNNTSALPPGLTEGYSAVALLEKVNGEYNCSSLDINKDQLLPLISDFNNWLGDDDNRFVLPPSCFSDPLSLAIIKIEAKISGGLLELDIYMQPGDAENYILELSFNYLDYDSIAEISIPANSNYFSYKTSVSQNYQGLRLKVLDSPAMYGPVNIGHETNPNPIRIYPNLYTGAGLHIFNLDENMDYELQVVNLTGQKTWSGYGKRRLLETELNSFAAQAIKGTYCVILHSKLKIYHEKLIIE
jgi:hypothetical protein